MRASNKQEKQRDRERGRYIENEIFVMGNEGEASSEMECPSEKKKRNEDADHSHCQIDRELHHRRRCHFSVLQRTERKRDYILKSMCR